MRRFNAEPTDAYDLSVIRAIIASNADNAAKRGCMIRYAIDKATGTAWFVKFFQV